MVVASTAKQSLLKTVLIVAADSAFTGNAITALEKEGYPVVVKTTAEDAVTSTINAQETGIIILGIDLVSDGNGVQAAEKLLTQRDVPVILTYSPTRPESIRTAGHINSYGYLSSDAHAEVIVASVQGAIRCFEMNKTSHETYDSPMVDPGIFDASNIARQAGLTNALLDTIPDIIFYKDLNGVYLGCNAEFARHLGLDPNFIPGKTDYDLYTQVEADFFREQDRRMLETLKPRHNEEWISYPDGRRICLDTLKTPYYGPDGSLIGLLGISRDITEQINNRKALLDSEERWKFALEGSNQGVWDWNVGTNETYLSPRWKAILGYDDHEIPSTFEQWETRIHPEDRTML
jgi:PAS domain S-box-containing protein